MHDEHLLQHLLLLLSEQLHLLLQVRLHLLLHGRHHLLHAVADLLPNCLLLVVAPALMVE